VESFDKMKYQNSERSERTNETRKKKSGKEIFCPLHEMVFCYAKGEQGGFSLVKLDA
jgi:nitrite reductase/ring-hydroxylating ferredoxin subunit